ncbi:MAG: bifunctional fucokinase/fucose-1-phosphate guanylyltransferase [Verrucomicrobiota bacterium]|nr:bifunctional fucokinase/fucose-1-phosphate guanylyltransferase [Limisphaera sp.]MDW8380578.1 bifunctional fucokinase/fucose-1-phosphate guanylyltransferase [Verrucomicrobiota bacterium]
MARDPAQLAQGYDGSETYASLGMKVQYLISLPPAMAPWFARLEGRVPPEWVSVADPPNTPIGSGGATAYMLAEAWRQTGSGQGFAHWLRQHRKILILAGGQSRRLPAYAPVGKCLMPFPVLRGSRGQRLDQTLLDMQVPVYTRFLEAAPDPSQLLLACGDVWIRPGPEMPPLPSADVVGLAVRVVPEIAPHFGVFFYDRRAPHRIVCVRQKPSAAEIRRATARLGFAADTGLWLLSERAVQVLMSRCGWHHVLQRFVDGRPRFYEFYAHFVLALGSEPICDDPEIRALSCAIVELPEAEFYHFGATAQMVESVVALQNRTATDWPDHRHSDQILQNCRVELALDPERHQSLWIENSVVGARWQLNSEHALTGVPPNDWNLNVLPGTCLDFVPVEDGRWCVRCYGYRDLFQGPWDQEDTLWMGKPIAQWFAARDLRPTDAGLAPGMDLHDCPLFPVLKEEELDPMFVEWLCSDSPGSSDALRRFWLRVPRWSAADLRRRCDVGRLYDQRASLRRQAVIRLRDHARWSIFYRLDLEATAHLVVGQPQARSPARLTAEDSPMHAVREAVFQAALMRAEGQPGWQAKEREAFRALREMLVQEAQLSPALPTRSTLEDQIVWARSPVRLDLAGGWTDTPPYCLEHGGCVLNLAVDLNGQPPLQVFAKCIPEPVLAIRSIDLSVEQRVRSYEELADFGEPGDPFGLARAALALAGFLPRFHAHGGFDSLQQQLQVFGAGLELSLVAAVPKGSGLGTSSILATTVLAALSDLCNLGWDHETLSHRTLVLEQLLGTGGGWQDQVGALEQGLKLIETRPGMRQTPRIHWLPQHLFEQEPYRSCLLLYYTGITRLAWNILADIVRAVFLNSSFHLSLLEEIGRNARRGALAVQRCDFAGLCDTVRQSWGLNQALDPATNPPAIQAILDAVQEDLAAAKLAGAGGGGYLLMIAKSPASAQRIRERLTRHPPNPRARFVDFSISNHGLRVTRS